MMRPPKPRKHARNNSCQQAYGSYANSFVVPLIPWPFPTPQSTPAPWVVEKDEKPATEPKPIPVIRLSGDTTASSGKVETSKVEISKPSLSSELLAARERALASLKIARAIRSQSEEREKEKERALQELWKQAKSEFNEFSSRRRKQFKESVIENEKLQHKKARDIEWTAITRRVRRIEVNIRKEREREESRREMEERQRETERKRKIELAKEIWRKENEDVVDYVWEL